jgi:hypothetical protein
MNDNSEAMEPVGYGKPPAKSRFQPGQSGNPKGRPKGSLNVTTILMKILRERVVITENGTRKTITKFEASLKQMVNKAASGDLRALTQLLPMIAVAVEQSRTEGSTSTEILKEREQEVLGNFLKRHGQSIKAEADHEANSD